jgi:mono/diheme cytochrome c family protein
MTRIRFVIAVGFVAASLGVADAQETALVETGAIIARGSCASCHAIGAGPDKNAMSAAPSFADIAAMPPITELAIKVFLQTPHSSMPNIMLAQAEINALAAYILSLRGK